MNFKLWRSLEHNVRTEFKPTENFGCQSFWFEKKSSMVDILDDGGYVYDVTHTHNHWSNTLTSVQFFEKILPPYMKSVQDSINNPKHKALLISDVFRAQHTQTLKDLMTANNCILQKVPASLTYHLQPLDISINGLTKKFMRN